MPRPKSQPKPDVLLEPPGPTLDNLAMVSELLSTRQEEYQTLQHNLNLLRATIQSERVQWDQERRRGEDQLGIRRQAVEEERHKVQLGFDQLHRKAQAAVERGETYEQEWKSRTLELNERELLLRNLSQERIEISKLRHAAELQRADASCQIAQLQTLQNEVNAARQQAEQLMAECERRNHLMNEEWNKLQKWQEDLTLRQKDYEILKQEVDRRLDTLSKSEVLDAHVG